MTLCFQEIHTIYVLTVAAEDNSFSVKVNITFSF